MQERKTLKLNEASSGWQRQQNQSLEITMSNDKKHDNKTPAADPKKLPLPATEQVEEIAETDLDGVAGGWCTVTTGACGSTAPRGS